MQLEYRGLAAPRYRESQRVQCAVASGWSAVVVEMVLGFGVQAGSRYEEGELAECCLYSESLDESKLLAHNPQMRRSQRAEHTDGK